MTVHALKQQKTFSKSPPQFSNHQGHGWLLALFLISLWWLSYSCQMTLLTWTIPGRDFHLVKGLYLATAPECIQVVDLISCTQSVIQKGSKPEHTREVLTLSVRTQTSAESQYWTWRTITSWYVDFLVMQAQVINRRDNRRLLQITGHTQGVSQPVFIHRVLSSSASQLCQ